VTEIVVQGDTAPTLEAVIHDADNAEAPLDLTNATSVAIQMRKPDDRRYTVNAQVDIITAVDGRVSYTWGPNDLAVPGEYQIQFEVTFNDGKIQTTRTPITIEVRRQ
jgi:5-hydroxyisourate hydrolase-like protein (transthyretin family)